MDKTDTERADARSDKMAQANGTTSPSKTSPIGASHSSTWWTLSEDAPSTVSDSPRAAPYGMQKWLAQKPHEEPWSAVGHADRIAEKSLSGIEEQSKSNNGGK